MARTPSAVTDSIEPTPVVERPPASDPRARHDLPDVLVGELVGLSVDDRTPLVAYAGQPGTAAIRAIAAVEIRGNMIGSRVVLSFEGADPLKPIVMGVVRKAGRWPTDDPPRQVSIEADGERLLIDAARELVLRCGKASITLTSSGKILIEGTSVSSRASGVVRVKGGSIELN